MKTSSCAPLPVLVFLLGFLLFSLSFSSPCLASDSVYDSFIECLGNHSGPASLASSIVFTQSNPSYSTVLEAYIRNRRFNKSSTPKPLIIVTPTIESHVQAAVLCSKTAGMLMKIRSGGHDYDGLSYVSDTPFFILDMFNLRAIDVNMADETAWVQAGATLGELYYRIWEKSKLHGFPAGVCATVGAGGHISGGGYGTMLRKYGLSIDHVVDAKIVDVNGRILDRKAMGEDLFWAIKGGGGSSFGVILAYRVKLVPVPETVTVFRVQRTLDQNATDLVYKWQLIADKIDNDLFIRVLLQPVTASNKKGKIIRASFISLFLGDAARLLSIMDKEFPELGLTKEQCMEMSWIESVLYWDGFDNGTSADALLSRTSDSVNFLKRKSDYVQKPINKDGLEWLWKKMIQLGKTGLVFNPYGGRMSEIPSSETAFPHRAGNIYKIQYSVNWSQEGEDYDKEYTTQIRRLYSYMTQFVSKSPRGAYLNYRDVEIGTTSTWSYDEGQVYGRKYFLDNYDRLVKVKTAVDPTNFFRNEQSIPVSK